MESRGFPTLKGRIMRKYLYISLACFAIAIVAFLHIGCVAQSFHKKVSVCLDVHIVSDISQHEYAPYRIYHSYGYTGGYATNKPMEIWILGKKKDNQYHVNLNMLGHEFGHILNFHDNTIRDPHEYQWWME